MPPLSSASGSSIRTVLLASVLKPLDDTRMYGKFGVTLAERPDTVVHVAGRAAAPPGGPANLHTHCLLESSRLSWARLAAQWRYWQLLRRLQPDLVVVHAPELLPLTLFWHWLATSRRQFLYDIRENYALNVSTQQVYGGFTRRWLAAGLRWVETRAAHRAVAVLLAEESYADELPFLETLSPARVLLLENKYQPISEDPALSPRPWPTATEPLRMLYSGTISRLNGIEEALMLAKELHQIRPGGAVLTVIGFCQQPDLLLELQQRQQANPAWLRLVVAAGPVPHRAIVAEIQHSHVGLLLYRPHPSTERCRPTKLFEYLAHGLPMLIPANPLWEEVVRRYQAGLVVDLQRMTDTARTLHEFTAPRPTATPFFYPAGIPAAAFWVSEGVKLRALVDSIR